jgi:hypothetical protein
MSFIIIFSCPLLKFAIDLCCCDFVILLEASVIVSFAASY